MCEPNCRMCFSQDLYSVDGCLKQIWFSMDIVETYVLYFYRDSKYSSWSFTIIILIWDPIDFSCAHDWHFNNTFLSCCHFNNTFSGSSKHTLGIQVFRRANVVSFTPRNSNSHPFCQSQTPARVICPGPSSASESQVSAPPVSQPQPRSTLLQWVDLCVVLLHLMCMTLESGHLYPPAFLVMNRQPPVAGCYKPHCPFSTFHACAVCVYPGRNRLDDWLCGCLICLKATRLSLRPLHQL